MEMYGILLYSEILGLLVSAVPTSFFHSFSVQHPNAVSNNKYRYNDGGIEQCWYLIRFLWL